MGRDNKAHYGLSLRVSPLGQVWQKEKRKKERLNDGNNNGQLRIATPPRVAHAKPPGPKCLVYKRLNQNSVGGWTSQPFYFLDDILSQ